MTATSPDAATPHFDLIVFGATSFVGQILTRYLAETYGLNGELKWAIAGRSESKLQSVRGSLVPALGDDAKHLPILLADAANAEQVSALCEQTNVIVSTVGPYALYGEPMIKACAESGTDYCDLTGEPQWIKRMLEKYEASAKASGARIVHCCGFDSVPSDMGVYFLQAEAQKAWNGKTASRIKMRVKAAKGGMSGGTVASIIQLTKEVMANPALRKELANPYSLCPPEHGFRARQINQKGVEKDTDLLSWSVPFIMAAINTRVVHRSNALRNKLYGENFMYDEAMLTGGGVKGYALAAALVGGMGTFMIGAALKPSRWLLEKFVLPKPGEGPTPKQQQEGYFDIRFIGRNDDGQTIMTRVKGKGDPGYGSTAKVLGQAASGIALDFYRDGQKCDREGGFWTPASMFDERFIQRLQEKADLSFEVLS